MKFAGNPTQYAEFVTPDSVMGDGSPDFSRIPLYFDWEDLFNYVANPRYQYPDRTMVKEQTEIVAQATEWIDSNAKKILLFVGLISLATIIVNVATYIIKRQKSKPQTKSIKK